MFIKLKSSGEKRSGAVESLQREAAKLKLELLRVGERPMKTLREARLRNAKIRLLQTNDGFAGIMIPTEGDHTTIRGDDPDDLWRRLHDEAAKNDPSFFGYEGARGRFLRIFRDGFKSAAYPEYERDYKLAAKKKLDEGLPLDSALNGSNLGEAALMVFRATNLLSPFEKSRLQEALRGPHADAFVRGAARFAQGEVRDGLAAMEKSLKPHDVAKWTVVTYLPFLWSPNQHMFLKPTVTQNFASRVGHRFANDYVPQLDEAVYESLLDLAGQTEREIAALGPQDWIDVQSFIWVVGEYDGKAEEGLR